MNLLEILNDDREIENQEIIVAVQIYQIITITKIISKTLAFLDF